MSSHVIIIMCFIYVKFNVSNISNEKGKTNADRRK